MAGTDLYPVAGAKLYIGGVLATKAADFVAADFASQTWTLVDGWEQVGDIGDSAALISTDLVNRGRTIKQKGTTNAGSMQNVFAILTGDAGQQAMIAASKSKSNYAFKIDWGDAPAVDADPVTVTIASPGVFTDTAHGFVGGETISFTTTGALPTGLTAGTTYYVLASGLTANSYSVAATPGGAAIATTGSQSGVHTRTTVPTSTLNYFVGLVMGAAKSSGTANNIRKLNQTIEVNSNIVEVAAAA
ncbi:hypothetical protein [Tardiphaga sp. 839_C3_N1_4]|uniref:hypothetical protein n=1 Tax=Tardiphaga sp. 839_C3_N1_4 TaxID=3240761 RepID=UPI003F1F7AD4